MIKDWASYVVEEDKRREGYNANKTLVEANEKLVSELLEKNRSAKTIGGMCVLKSKRLVKTLEKAMHEMREIEHLESLNADGTYHHVRTNPEHEVYTLTSMLYQTLAKARSYAGM